MKMTWSKALEILEELAEQDRLVACCTRELHPTRPVEIVCPLMGLALTVKEIKSDDYEDAVEVLEIDPEQAQRFVAEWDELCQEDHDTIALPGKGESYGTSALLVPKQQVRKLLEQAGLRELLAE